MKTHLNSKVLLGPVLLFCLLFKAQSIEMTPFIEDDSESIPREARQILLNKMGDILTRNDIVKGMNSTFILNTNATVLQQTLTQTVPQKHLYTVALNFFVGNGVDGNLFSSHTKTLTGLGNSRSLAYIDAFKKVNAADPEFQGFLSSAKNKVVQYYNSRCSSILTEVSTLEKTGRFEEALYKLTSIPSASSCYGKTQGRIAQVYQKSLEKDCASKLAAASQAWAASPNSMGASDAAEHLAGIDSSSKCYSGVRALSSKIERTMIQSEDREYKFRWEEQIGLEKQRLQMLRDVGMQKAAQTQNYVFPGWN